MGSTYPSSLSLKKKHIRIKHLRSANWMAPTWPQGCFSLLEGVSQFGGANMPPRYVYYGFEGVGAWFPIKFFSFSSISNQNPFVLKFPNNSHSFLLFSSITHQILLFPSSSQKNFILIFAK
jgi:hypothetical protein